MNDFLTFSNVIATISIAISIYVAYLTVLKNSKIDFFVGDTIAIWHENNNILFDIKVLFINKSPKPGVISNVTIQIFKKGEKAPIHNFPWQNYLEFRDKESGNPNSGKLWDRFPIFPISVSNSENITKNINFCKE